MQLLLKVSLFQFAAYAHFNEPISFVIGDSAPPYGAVTLTEDFSTRPLDLAVDCGRKFCPSILIFSGQQWGTVNVVNCRVGQQYMFINRSKVDLGVVIQQNGGAIGSKGIGRFDLGTCFCMNREEELLEDNEDLMSDPGVLLCR